MYVQLSRLAMARALGGSEQFMYRYDRPLPTGNRAELFILVERPSGFEMAPQSFGKEEGCVLYHVLLHLPDDKRR